MARSFNIPPCVHAKLLSVCIGNMYVCICCPAHLLSGERRDCVMWSRLGCSCDEHVLIEQHISSMVLARTESHVRCTRTPLFVVHTHIDGAILFQSSRREQWLRYG